MSNIKESLGKHLTHREQSGLSISEDKLSKILFQLQLCEDKIIKRYDLRLLIGKALTNGIKTIDRLTIYKFIDLMLNCGYITQNPTSHLIYTEEHQYTPTAKPHNDTKYIIQPEKIQEIQNQLYKKKTEFYNLKGKNIQHIDLLTIDSFIEGEENRSRSENQEEEKNKTILEVPKARADN